MAVSSALDKVLKKAPKRTSGALGRIKTQQAIYYFGFFPQVLLGDEPAASPEPLLFLEQSEARLITIHQLLKKLPTRPRRYALGRLLFTGSRQFVFVVDTQKGTLPNGLKRRAFTDLGCDRLLARHTRLLRKALWISADELDEPSFVHVRDLLNQSTDRLSTDADLSDEIDKKLLGRLLKSLEKESDDPEEPTIREDDLERIRDAMRIWTTMGQPDRVEGEVEALERYAESGGEGDLDALLAALYDKIHLPTSEALRTARDAWYGVLDEATSRVDAYVAEIRSRKELMTELGKLSLRDQITGTPIFSLLPNRATGLATALNGAIEAPSEEVRDHLGLLLDGASQDQALLLRSGVLLDILADSNFGSFAVESILSNGIDRTLDLLNLS